MFKWKNVLNISLSSVYKQLFRLCSGWCYYRKKLCLTTVGIEHTTFRMLAQCSANWATLLDRFTMWYFETDSGSFDIKVISRVIMILCILVLE